MCDRALLAVDSIKGQYNRYFAVYDDALRGKLLREQAITEAMETALDEGQFVVYLQPKYNLHDDRLAGAEALVRWNHPAWGFLSPGEFIPLFEKNVFITQLDQYVWEQVCALMKTWNEKGYPALPVSVNVSRSDIYQSDLAQTLLKIVHKYGLEPKQLHLELTESAYTENPNQIVGTVDHLRKLGFIIEMDDFGSGYSSLNMLNRMKLDVLKLDMKFIQSETAKPMEQGILRFVVGLGHWLNLSVVAEGVETREQLERLREVGCDYAQGYFFSKPMLSGEFENLMKAPVSEQPVFSQKQWQDKVGMRKILIADEDAEYRKRVCGLFKNEYQVIEACDAAQAIDCIKTDGQDPISAVIVSAALPDQGALSLLSFMRRDPMLWHIPVLATLPQAEEAAEVWMQLDTDDFLCKRHPLVDLKRRVRHLLRLALSQERERILKNEACQDYLTGLLNRRGFYTAIDTLRQEDLPLAMYLFDLDNLKKVNDQYGHEKGDEMIRSFGNLLRHHTRDGDILRRYGGDEFVVILRRISSENAILRKGAEICEGANRFFQAEGIRAGCSGGIALCREDDKPSARLIEQADKALYKAKQAGKGRCCLWEE